KRDWSSDVCSSDLTFHRGRAFVRRQATIGRRITGIPLVRTRRTGMRRGLRLPSSTTRRITNTSSGTPGNSRLRSRGRAMFSLLQGAPPSTTALSPHTHSSTQADTSTSPPRTLEAQVSLLVRGRRLPLPLLLRSFLPVPWPKGRPSPAGG